MKWERSRGQVMKSIEPLQRNEAYSCEQAIYFGSLPLVQSEEDTKLPSLKKEKETCIYEKYFLNIRYTKLNLLRKLLYFLE